MKSVWKRSSKQEKRKKNWRNKINKKNWGNVRISRTELGHSPLVQLKSSTSWKCFATFEILFQAEESAIATRSWPGAKVENVLVYKRVYSGSRVHFPSLIQKQCSVNIFDSKNGCDSFSVLDEDLTVFNTAPLIIT